MAKIIRQSEDEPCVRESILSLEGDANSLVSYFNFNMNRSFETSLLRDILMLLTTLFPISENHSATLTPFLVVMTSRKRHEKRLIFKD